MLLMLPYYCCKWLITIDLRSVAANGTERTKSSPQCCWRSKECIPQRKWRHSRICYPIVTRSSRPVRSWFVANKVWLLSRLIDTCAVIRQVGALRSANDEGQCRTDRDRAMYACPFRVHCRCRSQDSSLGLDSMVIVSWSLANGTVAQTEPRQKLKDNK
jgi:hypothetical protein